MSAECEGEEAEATSLLEPPGALISEAGEEATSEAGEEVKNRPDMPKKYQFLSVGEEQTQHHDGAIWPNWALLRHTKLLGFVLLWYYFNIQYNVENKRVLMVLPAATAVAWLQLASGIPIGAALWATRVYPIPKLTWSDLAKLFSSGVFFAMGQVATVQSLAASNVSFTHCVKAMEPAVNALVSAVLLEQHRFHWAVYCCLIPVIGGVVLASVGELSFTSYGFCTAMGSNVCFAFRNVLATKHGSIGDMGTDATARKTNQLIILTMIASVTWLPFALLTPGGFLDWSTAWAASPRGEEEEQALLLSLLKSSFYFFMYQVSSFWVLSCVQPLTHSVLNSLKRVAVIVAAIIVFQTPLTNTAAFGTASALVGVMMYSLAKGHFKGDGKKTVENTTGGEKEAEQSAVVTIGKSA